MRNTPKTLTLFIKNQNIELELPSTSFIVHPTNADGSIRVTLDAKAKREVTEFLKKGKVVAHTPEQPPYAVSLEDGKLKLSPKE